MPKASNDDRLAEAALRLLAKKSWGDLTLAEVAKAAKIPVPQLQSLSGGKAALLGAILRKLGAETASRYTPDKGSTAARDRIFDVAMSWFDGLASRKAAIRALHRGLKHDPLALIAARAQIAAGGSWLLTLACADTGPALAVRSLGLAAVVARAIPVWLDDGPDLAKTMAQLDGDLRRGENLFRRPGKEED